MLQLWQAMLQLVCLQQSMKLGLRLDLAQKWLCQPKCRTKLLC